jgi:hypothetical protein
MVGVGSHTDAAEPCARGAIVADVEIGDHPKAVSSVCICVYLW